MSVSHVVVGLSIPMTLHGCTHSHIATSVSSEMPVLLQVGRGTQRESQDLSVMGVEVDEEKQIE